MPEILRVALLGGGKMALHHATAIRYCRNATLVAVVDPHLGAAELTVRFGAAIGVFADVQTMLQSVKPDVVHIVTPPETHVALARQCIGAGAHVYVEKPFALTVADAEAVLRLADSAGRRICAAHQVLFQHAGRAYRKYLPTIGTVVHVESFFSFRPVRQRAGGGLSTPVDQLIDILPHPVYLLLDALPASGDSRAEVTALDVSIDGEVRAVIRKGEVLAMLVVSLRARPVESWLRVMGTNGMVEADFVLGTVVRHPGPGASAPAVVLKPFSRAWQLGWGSFKGVLRLVFRGHKSYPGLAELLERFYAAIRERSSPPVDAGQITDTVRICEAIGARLQADERAADARAAADIRAQEIRLPPLNARGIVLLTGGTGMLGRPTASLLRQAGWRIRVPIRRNLRARHRLPGVEYIHADLSVEVPDSLLAGVETVLHLAAETAGTQADHERNTIRATRHLLDAMVRNGVRDLANVSSVAVLRPSRFGRRLRTDSPVDHGNLKRGPYVWAKAEAERMADEFAGTGRLDVRTIRLGPLVDFQTYVPPGRLGREVARLFVAMGRPSAEISICDVGTAAATMCRYVERFPAMPSVVNLVEYPPMTRGGLVERLQASRPDLVVVWLPFWILRILSFAYTLAQKLRHPSKDALNLYSAFKSESFEPAGHGKA